MTELKLHTAKIESILKTDRHVFINSNIDLWSDKLFVDGEHLSDKGAKSFTEYCLDKIDTLKKQ